MPLVLKIIFSVFGYLAAGGLSIFLLPLYDNLWHIATFKFEPFSYDYDLVKDMFVFEDDDEVAFTTMYFAFWPIGHAVFLVIVPLVFFFNAMKTLFLLPTNIKEKNEKELEARKEYVREVERKYQNIMAKERANDFKDYRW